MMRCSWLWLGMAHFVFGCFFDCDEFGFCVVDVVDRVLIPSFFIEIRSSFLFNLLDSFND